MIFNFITYFDWQTTSTSIYNLADRKQSSIYFLDEAFQKDEVKIY